MVKNNLLVLVFLSISGSLFSMKKLYTLLALLSLEAIAFAGHGPYRAHRIKNKPCHPVTPQEVHVDTPRPIRIDPGIAKQHRAEIKTVLQELQEGSVIPINARFRSLSVAAVCAAGKIAARSAVLHEKHFMEQ